MNRAVLINVLEKKGRKNGDCETDSIEKNKKM